MNNFLVCGLVAIGLGLGVLVSDKQKGKSQLTMTKRWFNTALIIGYLWGVGIGFYLRGIL